MNKDEHITNERKLKKLIVDVSQIFDIDDTEEDDNTKIII